MAVTQRPYVSEPFFTDDYRRVREFLIRINSERLTSANFTWGRWEWMITHAYLDTSSLGHIGLWEDAGRIVALATYESVLGEAYFCLDEMYAHLKSDMIAYAKEALAKDGNLRILLPDGDCEFGRTAIKQGFLLTQAREHVALIDLDGSLSYTLPDGFSLASLADSWDWRQYDRVMWRGFNHAGPPPQTDQDIAVRKQMLSSPTINPDLVLAVVSPQGDYVAHGGLWYRPGDSYAYVEPVATDPDYRFKGLGKAVVYEALTRCRKLGAKQALVGSSQQFYYNLGFFPFHTATWWEQKR